MLKQRRLHHFSGKYVLEKTIAFLPFLPDRMTIGKVEKLVANVHDITEYVTPIRILKQALNRGFVHRVIKLNQNAWLKPYIQMNSDLKKPKKKILKNIF